MLKKPSKTLLKLSIIKEPKSMKLLKLSKMISLTEPTKPTLKKQPNTLKEEKKPKMN